MKLTIRRSQTLDGEVKLEIASPARYGGSRALKFFHLQAKKSPKVHFLPFLRAFLPVSECKQLSRYWHASRDLG